MNERKLLKKDNTFQQVYCVGLVFGLLFFIFGIIQLVNSLGFFNNIFINLYIPMDIIGSFILILTGIIFMYGILELNKGMREGSAFVYVGIVFSLFFMGIYLLNMLINGIQAYIVMNSEFDSWSPLNDLRPGIYLGLLSLIVLFMWREKLSFKKIKS